MKALDPKVRQAAEGYLLAGNSPGWVAKKMALPLGTIKNWARALKKSDLVPAAVDTVDRSDLAHLGELILRNLAAKLTAAESLAKLVQDPVWQRRQDANQIANLLSKLDPATIRLIEAMERANPPKTE